MGAIDDYEGLDEGMVETRNKTLLNRLLRVLRWYGEFLSVVIGVFVCVC